MVTAGEGPIAENVDGDHAGDLLPRDTVGYAHLDLVGRLVRGGSEKSLQIRILTFGAHVVFVRDLLRRHGSPKRDGPDEGLNGSL